MWRRQIESAPARTAVLVTLADRQHVTIALRIPNPGYAPGPVWETLGGATIADPVAWMQLPDPASID